MPIITKEQLFTLTGLLLFCLIGIILYQFKNFSGRLNHFPERLLKRQWVEINLDGAVSRAGERKVLANDTMWQVISNQNQWNSYVNWGKIPLATQPYHGMEYHVPFRLLRAGEILEVNEIVSSKGRLLNCIPCFKRKDTRPERISNRVELIKFSKNFNKYECFKKYISGI